MATKGELTRRMILETAAPLFNTRGYFGASMSDLVRETGLEKGGIYNHFSGKEELALEAFDYATGLMRERLRSALEGREGALERLLAVVDVFSTLAYDPPVEGGCPVLNTAVESDDSMPVLKERAKGAALEWLQLVGSITKEGTDPNETATVVVAAIEGAVMLSKLTDDAAHMDRAVDHLKGHLRSLARPRDPGEEKSPEGER
jgi:TetR/AcrR family transcriptional regulator, transcriptional repressor for nem operon